MNWILLYILLATIAYILWLIYYQKEKENKRVAIEKFAYDQEQKRKENIKNYPHLARNIDDTWLKLFGKVFIEKNIPHLKAMFFIYLKEANNTKLDVEISFLFDSLWNLSEELLEHLEKYHESSKYEYEIAVLTYWQIAAEKAESFIGKDIEIIRKMFQSSPFTDIEKISFWFPKKDNHPDIELSFRDERGIFPRESEGAVLIHSRLKVLGL